MIMQGFLSNNVRNNMGPALVSKDGVTIYETTTLKGQSALCVELAPSVTGAPGVRYDIMSEANWAYMIKAAPAIAAAMESVKAAKDAAKAAREEQERARALARLDKIKAQADVMRPLGLPVAAIRAALAAMDDKFTAAEMDVAGIK